MEVVDKLRAVMSGDLSRVLPSSSLFFLDTLLLLEALDKESSRRESVGADWEAEEVGRPVNERVEVDGLEL